MLDSRVEVVFPSDRDLKQRLARCRINRMSRCRSGDKLVVDDIAGVGLIAVNWGSELRLSVSASHTLISTFGPMLDVKKLQVKEAWVIQNAVSAPECNI